MVSNHVAVGGWPARADLRYPHVMRFRTSLAVFALTGPLLLLPGPAAGDPDGAPEIRPGTIAFDYANKPQISRYLGYQYAVLSPRAVEIAEKLAGKGTKIVYWLQPVVCFWKGKPPDGDQFYGRVYALATRHDAALRDRGGDPAEIRGSDIEHCYVLDFANLAFANDLAELVVESFPNGSGILFDYGCTDLSWELSLKSVDPKKWDGWAEGYRRYRARLTQLRPDWIYFCQCDKWVDWLPEVCSGLVFEQVGATLNPYDKIWSAISDGDTHNLLLVDEELGNVTPGRRQLTAAMAYLTDGYLAYRLRSGNQLKSVKNPEHFDLDLGKFSEAMVKLSEGVYRRDSDYGFVVLNLSEERFKVGKIWVEPENGLVVQTTDPDTGEEIPWRTTVDR